MAKRRTAAAKVTPRTSALVRDALVKRFESLPGVSVSTQRSYSQCTSRLHEVVPGGVLRAILDPEGTLRLLRSGKVISRTTGAPISAQTVRAYTAAIMAALKHARDVLEKTPGMPKINGHPICWGDLREEWVVMLRDVNREAFKHYGELRPTDNHLAAHVEWKAVLKARDRAIKAVLQPSKGGEAPDEDAWDTALLLALYTYLPPMRADVDRVRVLRWTDPEDKALLDLPPEKLDAQVANRVEVRPAHGKTVRIVLSEFKTKSERFPRMTSDPFPEPLEKVMEAALADRRKRWQGAPGAWAEKASRTDPTAAVPPWGWLFVAPKTGQPYDTPEAAAARLRGLLRAALDNPKAGFNTLRHSFIMTLDMNKITPNERERISRHMMHSLDMQAKYRYEVPE